LNSGLNIELVYSILMGITTHLEYMDKKSVELDIMKSKSNN